MQVETDDLMMAARSSSMVAGVNDERCGGRG